MILEISQKLQEFSSSQRGVFSLGDLKNLIDPGNKAVFYRALSKLSEAGILKQFCRSFYITKIFDIQTLSQRICSDSYISFGTVLAKNLIIGSVPTYRLQAVKLGPSRVYKNMEYKIEQLSITNRLFMGFENTNGVNIATPEKAFIDTLYYYQRGMKFSFDVYSDIDCKSFNQEKIESYLKEYKNKKFISFVKGVINGQYKNN